MIIKLFLIFISLFFILNCQTEFEMPDLKVNSPINLKAYPTNKGIILKFYGNNREEGFRGYNVYVSANPNIKYQNLEPVKNIYGSTPTLPYGYQGCFPDGLNKSFITVTKDSYNQPILNYKKYYVAVNSVVIINEKEYKSDFSNEAEIIPLNETNISLNNHNITGIENDCIIFSSNNLILTNAPDVLPAVFEGDIIFELKNIEGTILPCIVIKSNNRYIQSLGYYNNLYEIDYIPKSGYISPPAEILVHDSFVYIFYKPSINKYIRIYITDAPENQTSILSDVQLKIKCLF
jgi:hypothetical protein